MNKHYESEQKETDFIEVYIAIVAIFILLISGSLGFLMP